MTVTTLSFLCFILLVFTIQEARAAEPKLAMRLAGDFRLNEGEATIKGPHRFLKVTGKVGYHPLSLRTSLRIPTKLQQNDKGSIILWIAPLETLGVASAMSAFREKDPNAQNYALLSDSFPINTIENSIFAWYWRSYWHPQMIAKFMAGSAGGGKADFGITPYVPVEHLPLIEKNWYQLAFTWDKTGSTMKVYVNGILAGMSDLPFKADNPKPELYLGNTAMVFSDLEIYDEELSAAVIRTAYERSSVTKNPEIEARLLSLFTVTPKKRVDWTPNELWKLSYETSLTKQGDFAGWSQQGSTDEPFKLKELGITPEGLLIQTSDTIHKETRVYFWSPQNYEGDIAIQYDFRPEKDSGLALLVIQASGMQREDFLTDHPKRTSGAMGTIIGDRVRNYHWEFFRKTVDVRYDLGTQVLVKNPWQRPLGMSVREPYKTGEWYRLLFVREGGHLRAAINGEWLLDVEDDPLINAGPVFNHGRIGLRLMYQTRMRFKDLKIWNRHTGVEDVR